MPIYDYHCPACQNDFELLVRSSTVPACPQCGAAGPERRLSLTAPQGTSQGIIAAGRRAAAREGHFSNYSKAERAKLK
jgi:putative FmdB family regulatory protein